MTNEQILAHVRKNTDGSWSTQKLDVHLQGTARRAREFADAFANGDWAEIEGFWHDLGKFLPDWQKHIRRSSGYDEDAHVETTGGRVNHSSAGAVLAFKRLKNPAIARILAYVIAGHHAGLPDWYPDQGPGDDLGTRLFSDALRGVLDTSDLDQIERIAEAIPFLEKDLPRSAPLGIVQPGDLAARHEHLHLWVRMLYSCLVDADFLDTEEFMSPENTGSRGEYPNMADLKIRFDRYMNEKQGSVIDSMINRQRASVLALCRKKAKLPPGIFSLTVPTGGGKTLSAMAFALEHAIKHDKRRIIMAIPYTSIIEQTAKVYKYGTDDDDEIESALKNGHCLFGGDAVLEHHSNLDPEKEDHKSRLASENWDAPIIVTTNVQLFESLFASRSSASRKLHNLVDSVIILDEAQMLPPEYLRPILSVLRGLVDHFGVTLLLCTATQPALVGQIGSPPNVFAGLSNVTEIVDDSLRLARELERVELIMPRSLDVRSEWKEIAEELVRYDQVLCIVNSRKDCRELHSLMPEGTLHLSALMCGEERSEVIAKIKRRLRSQETVRVISTQLVEAGVDIDFPVVYRALAGLDSIAQAAGRCNREGKLNEKGSLGRVIVFNPPAPAPVGLLRKGEDACKAILRARRIEELIPDLFREYFLRFYGAANDLDKPNFVERLAKEATDFKFQFRTFAQEFRLIDDTVQKSIIVWYGEEKKGSIGLIEQLRNRGPERWITRKLQRFVVNVPLPLFNRISEAGFLEELHGYSVQRADGLYRPGLGLLSVEAQWNDLLYIA